MALHCTVVFDDSNNDRAPTAPIAPIAAQASVAPFLHPALSARERLEEVCTIRESGSARDRPAS